MPYTSADLYVRHLVYRLSLLSLSFNRTKPIHKKGNTLPKYWCQFLFTSYIPSVVISRYPSTCKGESLFIHNFRKMFQSLMLGERSAAKYGHLQRYVYTYIDDVTALNLQQTVYIRVSDSVGDLKSTLPAGRDLLAHFPPLIYDIAYNIIHSSYNEGEQVPDHIFSESKMQPFNVSIALLKVLGWHFYVYCSMDVLNISIDVV